MITEIELENVRIFEGVRWKFRTPQLSCYCGTNSSGKSTILKTLLLLRQSLGIRESHGGLRGGRLRFVGSQVDLGNYKSLVSRNESNRDITIGLTIEDVMPLGFISHLRSIRSKTKPEKVPHLFDEEALAPYRLKSNFTFGLKLRNEELPVLPENPLIDEDADAPLIANIRQGLLKEANYEIVVQEEKLLEWKVLATSLTTGKSKRVRYELLVPRNYIKHVSENMHMDVEFAGLDEFVRIETTLRGLLPDSMTAKWKGRKERKHQETEELSWTNWPLPPHIDGAVYDLRRALTDIHYLAPLRSPAKRYYVAPLDVSTEMDPAGEFLPYILQEKSHIRVVNVRPGEKEVTKRDSLEAALNCWMYYLRTGSHVPVDATAGEVELSTINNVLVEFKVKAMHGNKTHALADSGFGFSQVLPILVRGLLAKPSSTLIIEQPELHLNPALQVRLAEFFVAMARAGKQIMIETHSEHIVNTIRILAAEDETSELAKLCGVYYISTEAARPKVHELCIKNDGTIPDWPKHFFGEALSLASRLLKAQRRFRTPSND